MSASQNKLKTIRFEGEMLPKWAQLLDVAAQLCLSPEETRDWFSRFTNSTGVDDARTIIDECNSLLTAIRENRGLVLRQLERVKRDPQPSRIVMAWEYALETMILEARSRKTCSWRVEGAEPTPGGDFGEGDITLRRL